MPTKINVPIGEASEMSPTTSLLTIIIKIKFPHKRWSERDRFPLNHKQNAKKDSTTKEREKFDDLRVQELHCDVV
jgi:hypothetical protein